MLTSFQQLRQQYGYSAMLTKLAVDTGVALDNRDEIEALGWHKLVAQQRIQTITSSQISTLVATSQP